MPEILEVELYRALAEQALHRPIEKVWMVDARYGRGGTTPGRLRSALVGHTFTAARRRGKLMLLDTEGPTLGVRFGMTGGLVVDAREALDRLQYGPGVFGKQWVRAHVTFDDGGTLLVHDPRRFGSLELAPDEGRLGPERADGDPQGIGDRPVGTAGPGGGRRTSEGPPDGPGTSRRHRQPLGRRDPGGPDSIHGGARRSTTRSSATSTRCSVPRCGNSAGAAAPTWGI